MDQTISGLVNVKSKIFVEFLNFLFTIIKFIPDTDLFFTSATMGSFIGELVRLSVSLLRQQQLM